MGNSASDKDLMSQAKLPEPHKRESKRARCDGAIAAECSTRA